MVFLFAGPQAGSGAGLSNITADERDRLLSLLFYQVVVNANTPAELEATGVWETALGVLTGAGESLYFSKSGSEVPPPPYPAHHLLDSIGSAK